MVDTVGHRPVRRHLLPRRLPGIDGRWLILDTADAASRRWFPTSSVEGFAVTASWWTTDGRSTLPVQ